MQEVETSTGEHSGMILVTGGSGFLGGAIVRQLLARGDKVRSFQRSDTPELRALGANVFRGDLADKPALATAAKGCRAVIHAGAKVGVWGDHADYYRSNVVGTRNVIEACRANAISRLVYTSSPSVIHSGNDIEGCDESAPLAAHFDTPYQSTKAEAETLVRAANSPRLTTVVLRPHLIWGPNDPQLTARVLARARQGRLRLVGGGLKKIDSVYIDNAVHAHLLALDRLRPDAACAGRAYFITQGQPTRQRDLINGILAAGGLPPCEKSISPRTAYMLGAVLEVVWTALRRKDEPVLTRFLAKQLGSAHWYDITAAKRDLGYDPAVTTAEGLRLLAASLSEAEPARKTAW